MRFDHKKKAAKTNLNYLKWDTDENGKREGEREKKNAIFID